MKHLYLFTLEIAPLEVGGQYDDLPSHLTLISRFLSELSPEELVKQVRPLLAATDSIHLAFGETIELGPKKVTAHMVDSPSERQLHHNLRKLLDTIKVEHQYPEFIGGNHKAHVTQRPGVEFKAGSERIAPAAYLIEIVDGKRIVRARLELAAA